MNPPRAIELALAGVLRQYAELSAGTAVRAWQSLRSDPGWDEEKDRTFPLVDVRCAPPTFDDNERTMYCECAVLCATKTDDDKDHAVVSSIYGEVQRVLDLLYSQFIGTAGEEYAAFSDALAAEAGDGFNLGGLSWGTPAAPYDDGGINMIGISIRVHFSRADF